MTDRQIKKLASLIAQDLFTAGVGPQAQRAERLVLTIDRTATKPPRDLGGWGQAAMAHRIYRLLSAAQPAQVQGRRTRR